MSDRPPQLPPRDATPNIAKALALVAAEISDPPALAKNAHFGQPYADLKSVVQAIRKPCARHGISIVQSPTTATEGDKRSLVLRTVLTHSSGEKLEFDSMWALPLTANIQQFGGAITYLRRYTLCALFNVVGDPDDDAEIIVQPTRQEGKKTYDPSRSNPPR